MSLVITEYPDAEKLAVMFADMNRGEHFTMRGYQALIDLFDNCESDTELDIIAITCEYTESTIAEIIDTYPQIVESEEEFNAMSDDDKAEVIGDYLACESDYIQFEDDDGNIKFVYRDF